MNKARINELLPDAAALLKTHKVANEKAEIQKTFRGYISSFGAAIVGGSILAAVAFFSNQSGAKSDRSKLMKIIFDLIDQKFKNGSNDLFECVANNKEQEDEIKEEIYNAAIAVKLAMSTYKLV